MYKIVALAACLLAVAAAAPGLVGYSGLPLAYGSGIVSPLAYGSGLNTPLAYGSGIVSPLAYGSGLTAPLAYGSGLVAPLGQAAVVPVAATYASGYKVAYGAEPVEQHGYKIAY